MTSTENFDTKEFYGQGGFPQPYIWSTGYVTSGGDKDTTRFFLPNGVTVSQTGTGVYKIVHKIGYSNRYLVVPTAVSTTAVIFSVANINADDVEIRTFNIAGIATSAAFSFTIYIF